MGTSEEKSDLENLSEQVQNVINHSKFPLKSKVNFTITSHGGLILDYFDLQVNFDILDKRELTYKNIISVPEKLISEINEIAKHVHITREEIVEEFQIKQGCPYCNIQVSDGNSTENLLRQMANSMAIMNEEFLVSIMYYALLENDQRAFRIALMYEELRETIQALLDKDEIEFADGLADLQYTLSGAAVTFDIPLEECFMEVHRSNMTKDIITHKNRREKGPNYKAPDIQSILEKHRKR